MSQQTKICEAEKLEEINSAIQRLLPEKEWGRTRKRLEKIKEALWYPLELLVDWAIDYWWVRVLVTIVSAAVGLGLGLRLSVWLWMASSM